MKGNNKSREHKELSELIGKALRAASRRAKKPARMYGTPIYIWQDGKGVAKKPQVNLVRGRHSLAEPPAYLTPTSDRRPGRRPAE